MVVVELCEKLFKEENFNVYMGEYLGREQGIEITLTRDEAFLLEDFFRHLSDHLLKSYITANFHEIVKGEMVSLDPSIVLRSNAHLRWFFELGVKLMWNLSTGTVSLTQIDQRRFYGLVRFMEIEYKGLVEYQREWESTSLKFWEVIFGSGFAKPRGFKGLEILSALRQKFEMFNTNQTGQSD